MHIRDVVAASKLRPAGGEYKGGAEHPRWIRKAIWNVFRMDALDDQMVTHGRAREFERIQPRSRIIVGLEASDVPMTRKDASDVLAGVSTGGSNARSCAKRWVDRRAAA